MAVSDAYRNARSRVLDSLNEDMPNTSKFGRVEFSKGLNCVLTDGGDYLIPAELRSSLVSMMGLVRLRSLTTYEQAVLCRYVRQLLALYATREIPLLPFGRETPASPPTLLTRDEHQLALEAQLAGVDWLEVGLMAGAVIGGAALMVTGLGALGAAVGGALGGGMLASAASQGVTGAAQHAIPEAGKMMADSFGGQSQPAPVKLDGRALASMWRGALGIDRIPDSYEEMRRLHRQAEQDHQDFTRRREEILRMWRERVAAVERMLPLQTLGRKHIHKRKLWLWSMVMASVGGYLIAFLLGVYSGALLIPAFIMAFMAIHDDRRTSAALAYQGTDDEDLLQYALDFQYRRGHGA